MRRLFEYALYRALAFLVPLLPRRAMVFLGRRLGGLYYVLSPTSRAVGMENLARAFPGRSGLAPLLRESLRLQGVAVLDALWSARLTAERARKWVAEGDVFREQLRKILARGRGIVVATAHFGSWEMFNAVGGALGVGPSTVISRPLANPLVDAHLRKMREARGNRLVPREAAILACASALRRGEIVCSVIDMAVLPQEGGVFIDFFGTPALASLALPALAFRRAAPLAFAVCRPLERGLRYRIEA
ncbi:MAG: lysophospholipid acyltransferase family protein, partial [Planctomycetota bacterium]